MTANPILVEVTRGPLVESRHCGALAVVGAAGDVRLAIGDAAGPVFPRSAVKAIQALPLIESGAADAFGFGPEELALACASHSGTPRHVEVVTRMLARAGAKPSDLECGIHAPADEASRAALIRAGEAPSALHNNCSGKHAGFIALARHLGVPIAGYVGAGHPVQQRVTAALADLTGARLDGAVMGTDGCSIPTFAVPLTSLAAAFARLGTGAGLPEPRSAAAVRLIAACTAEPELMEGAGRFSTEMLRLFAGRLFIKAGAEGVICAVLPARGLGIALKADDGAPRAAEAMMAAALAALLPMDEAEKARLATWVKAPVRSRRDAVVGEVRPTRVLVEALANLRQ